MSIYLLIVLKFVDYKSEACFQSYSVILGIRLLMTAVPFVLICVAQVILLYYPISEKQRLVNNTKIKHLLDEEREISSTEKNGISESNNSVTRIIESSIKFSRYESLD